MIMYAYMSAKQKEQKQETKDISFVRKTVTIPEELSDFTDEQVSQPEHAGNFSSYVRSLILRDRKEKLQAA